MCRERKKEKRSGLRGWRSLEIEEMECSERSRSPFFERS